MNKVILKGRLTADPEIREGETTIARFTLAVDRRRGEEADFISCVAFGKIADSVGNNWTKGKEMLLEGRIQTGSYKNKDDRTVYTTDVILTEFPEFCGKKE